MESSVVAPFLLLCSWFLALCVGFGNGLPHKAVNLGGWLVVEGWIKPSLFQGIPNKDLLDGTQVQFKSAKLNKYISAKNGGGSILVANTSTASGWETFRLWRINKSTFNLRVFNKKFVGLDREGSRKQVVAFSDIPRKHETFQILRHYNDPNRIRIKAPNGYFLQAKTETLVTADYDKHSRWVVDDPSVFIMSNVSSLQGEYQLTNGYGSRKASKVLRNHWSTFITERDFKFIARHNLNAVRVPVGWWISHDPNPPKPFVGGSLRALDKAFHWGAKYQIKIIIDLHAARGSQNGGEHSGLRDGYIEWGVPQIDETVAVIDFLASRYANHTSLGGIQLLNEPRPQGVNLSTLMKYYKAAYHAVRRHTSTSYVILSNRLGDEADPRELIPFARSLSRVVIDVHYYNIYSDVFKSMTMQQAINYVHEQRSSDLRVISGHGPLIFVGEWTGELPHSNATREDFVRYNQAQMEVYGNASFGWSYWTYKCFKKHWSLKWMIDNGYIVL